MRQKSPHEKLKALIYAKRKKEHECRAYLKYAEDILFKRPGSGIACDIEYRGHSGDSDYIITGLGNESGCDVQLAVIWELKAPQCFLFEVDPKSSNRIKPTKELIEAENQLLNYYDELKNSGEFRDEFGITLPDYVRLGGIIIGSDKTLIRGKIDDAKRDSSYRKALRCRKIFYGEKIDLLIWNTILDQLKPPELPPRSEAT